jgi:hypothetical protein
MLAGVRSCFLLSFLLTISLLACVPVQAQVNGVPASVTSLGFGGSTNPNPGIRASVTSLGPNGFNNTRPIFGNCCASFFWLGDPNPQLFSGHRHHRRDRDKDKGRDREFGVGVLEPAYIPYATDIEEGDEDSPDTDYADNYADYVHAPAPRRAAPPAKHVADSGSTTKASEPDKPEEPVASQPATLLVFRDGHRSDVLNYAIVGDTLFDFAEGRTKKILLADLDLTATRKANDDRGVDFQIPAANARQ